MQDYNQIIGNEEIIAHLQNAVQSGKVSHAYIFHGEEGMGKKMLADLFAKTLQCREGGIKPCNRCKSCIQADSLNQPDIIRVTHEKDSIGVDDIRMQVNGTVQIKPYDSPYKIYIIDSAEKLTEQAQNALLKTMEEPPEYVVILLLTENLNRLLPTILSRCVVLNLRPVSKDAIKEFLMKEYKVPDYVADMAANFAGGNVGKAIKYASSEDFENKKEGLLQLLRNINDYEIQDIIEALKNMTAEKASIHDYLDLMLLWYRDVLMLKATKNHNLLLFKNEYSYLNKEASLRSYENLDNIINAIDKAKTRLKANVNLEITIQLMLLSIKENANG